MSCFKKILGLAVVAAFGVYLFVWFGFYNVAANNKHWDVTTKFLGLALHRSVKFRAIDMPVPDLTDRARIERGAANYDAMCAQCHLAPGIETSELQEGMYPQPPVLYKKANFASKPNEDFWIIKNGIKMTGMPSWGMNNSDDQIWDMIALIRALDYMTPEQYNKLAASGDHTHKDDVPHKDEKPHDDKGADDHGTPNMQKMDTHDEGASATQKMDTHDEGALKKEKIDSQAEAAAEEPAHVDKEGDHPQ